MENGLEGMDDMEAMEAMEAMAAMEGYGEEDDDDDDKYDEDLKALESNQSPPNKQSQRQAADTGKESDGDNYSSDGSDNKMFMDIGDLKRQQETQGTKGAKDGKKKAAADDDDYDADEFD